MEDTSLRLHGQNDMDSDVMRDVDQEPNSSEAEATEAEKVPSTMSLEAFGFNLDSVSSSAG